MDKGSLALAAFDLLPLAVDALLERMNNAGMGENDRQLLVMLCDLQSWAMQAASGENVSIERGSNLFNEIRVLITDV